MKPCFIRNYSCPSWAQISLVFNVLGVIRMTAQV